MKKIILLLTFFFLLVPSVVYASHSYYPATGSCTFQEEYTTTSNGYQIEFVRGSCTAGAKFEVGYSFNNTVDRSNTPTTEYISITPFLDVWPDDYRYSNWNDYTFLKESMGTINTYLDGYSFFDFKNNVSSFAIANSSVRSGKGAFTAYRYFGGLRISSVGVTLVANSDTDFAFAIYTGFLDGDVTNSIIASQDSYQNDQVIKGQQDTKEAIDRTNDTLNDDTVDGAGSTGSSFFENFSSDDHGLSGIITTPLAMIQSITTSTCSPLRIPLPFVDKQVELPCMNTIYRTYFGNFLTLYQTITFGIVSYWVCVNIFRMVKGFKDPDKDEIEVMDL